MQFSVICVVFALFPTTGNENIIAFMKFLARLKKLRWLNLEKSNIPTEMIELLGKNPVMKTLKRLIIRNIDFCGEARAKNLAVLLDRAPNM